MKKSISAILLFAIAISGSCQNVMGVGGNSTKVFAPLVVYSTPASPLTLPFYGMLFTDNAGDTGYVGVNNSPYYTTQMPWVGNNDIFIGANIFGASAYYSVDLVGMNGSSVQLGFQGDPVPCYRLAGSLSSQFNGALGIGSGDTIVARTSANVGAKTEVFVDPTSIKSSLALTLIRPIVDGMQLHIHFGGTLTSGAVITSLSFTTGTGVTRIVYSSLPTTANVGDAIDFVFRSTGVSSGYWYKQ